MPTDECGEGRLAGGIVRLVNRSMSWRSVNPATDPPSNNDPICRTTEWFLTGNMPKVPLRPISVRPARASRSFPHPYTASMPNYFSRVVPKT